MTTRITGIVRDLEGQPLVNSMIRFERRSGVRGQDGATVVPRVVNAKTDAGGNISVDLYPGEYSAQAERGSGALSFKVGVPEDVAQVQLQDLIDQIPSITPTLVSETRQARDESVEAAESTAGSAEAAEDSASSASASADAAEDSASSASASADAAANSATAAATSETNAAQSATDAQDAVDTIDEPTIVRDFGDQTIGGVKTFSDGVEADSYGGDGVTQSFDDNTEGRLVRVQDGDGRYMLALPARRQINMLERFEPGDASFDALGNIEIAAPDGTGAVGLYGGAISFARPDGSSRRRAAIAAVQTRASENQVGLAFFTSGGTATSTNNISLRAMLRDTGSFYLAKSDYYANWNQSYDDPQGDLVYHTANLVGTVSQSGGTPTGAVIERGSNSNGEYVRFADGTQICTNDDVANVSVEDESGNWWRSPLFTWDFPVSFSSRPFVYGGVGGTSGADCNRVVGTFGQSSTTQATLRVFTASGSASNQSRIGACAVGRWF